jgi:hypothetical protein
LSGKPKTVKEYLKALKETKKGKPAQIKDALDIYIELWERIMEKGIIAEGDPVEVALSKIDGAGGLYDAAG